MVSILYLLLSTLGVGVSWATPPADDAPAARASEPAPAETPETAAEVRTAEDLLDRLEEVEDDLRTFEAGNVRYTTISELAGDMQQRIGSLIYDTGRDATGKRAGPRRFGLVFEGMRVGDRIDRSRGEEYVFDGRWLLEKRPQEKQAIRRELVAPGDEFDPLAVGNSPFFVPIGQRKEEVLGRFEAELVEPGSGLRGDGPLSVLEHLRPFTEGTYQLRLTPRPGVADQLGGVEEIRIWYDRDTLLPTMAKVQDTDLDHQIVELRQTRVNPDLPPDAFSTLPPPAGEGWDVQIVEDRPRRRVGDGA